MRFSLDVRVENSTFFNFDMIPIDFKSLVVNLTVKNTVMADLDASGFEYLQNLHIENVQVTDENFYLMPLTLKVSQFQHNFYK